MKQKKSLNSPKRTYEKKLVGTGFKKVYVKELKNLPEYSNRGLFSKKSLKRGDIVFIAKGIIYTEIVTTLEASMAHRDAIGISKDTWLDPFKDNPLRYLNHSCRPNLGIKGRVTFVALRDIKINEHLTLDYSITECDLLWNFKTQTGELCKCGETKCRQEIRSIQFLPRKFYKSYLPYIPLFLQHVYNKHNKSKL